MKKFFWTLAVLLILSAVSMAQVGTPSSPLTFYAGGALSLPTSPQGFSDGWKLGMHGMLGAGKNVSPRLQLIGKLEYHKFSADAATTTAYFGSPNVEGGAINTWMYGIDGRINLGAPVVPIKPYALGGIGIANLSFGEYTTTDTSLSSAVAAENTSAVSMSKVYFNFGGGVEFAMGPKTSLFVQARYVSIATDGGSTAFIPVTVGLKIF